MQHFILLLAIFGLFDGTWGHGMMLDPVGRSSRWRYDRTAPANYDDDGLFCGGLGVQYDQNGGKCGICGDNYADPTPRANELGGIYGGKGKRVKIYRMAHTINVSFVLTTNHLGHISFDLCNLDKSGVESEDCFEHRLKFTDNSDKFYVGNKKGKFNVTVSLPEDVKCKHCILRWTYHAANNWNFCGDGEEGAMGCGDQETFKSCADVSII